MTTRVETVRVFIFTARAEFSNCPLITSPIRILPSKENEFSPSDFASDFSNIKERTKIIISGNKWLI